MPFSLVKQCRANQNVIHSLYTTFNPIKQSCKTLYKSNWHVAYFLACFLACLHVENKHSVKRTTWQQVQVANVFKKSR